jgi:DNA polymerase-4
MVRTTLAYLADRGAGRLRASGWAGRTVTVRIRFAGLRSVTRSTTVPVGVSATLTVTELATRLVEAALADARTRRISLLAVSVSHLGPEPAHQLELPLGFAADAQRPGTRAGSARGQVDRAMDAVRARYGRHAVGYAAAALADQERVPDAFRELAERRPPGEPDRS